MASRPTILALDREIEAHSRISAVVAKYHPRFRQLGALAASEVGVRHNNRPIKKLHVYEFYSRILSPIQIFTRCVEIDCQSTIDQSEIQHIGNLKRIPGNCRHH